MKPKHQRLLLIGGGVGGLGLATFLTLSAFQEALVFFYTPTELAQKMMTSEQRVRVGGLVGVGSVQYNGDTVRFTVTDHTNALTVTYRGLLPDLFREGKGVVAEGYLVSPTLFHAETVLAKHDENYIPKEIKNVITPTRD